jgi:3-oxoacyl-[acyl-carrier-protein] synthase-3
MGKQTGILATEFSLPEQTLSYEELEERFGSDAMKKVMKGAGIRNRRVAPPHVTGSDLAYDAACRLIEHHHIDRDSIDLLIFCTQSPDYFLPSTACVLHERLGLKQQCASFDINLGCSQYIYALAVAHGMLSTGVASKALILTGDTMSRTLHSMDRSVVPLLGDAGSASLIGEVPEGQGFLGFELGTDGTGHKYLIIPAGGFRMPVSEETARETTDEEGNVRTLQNLYMNGAAIFHFAISVVPIALQSLLAKLHLSIEDVDFFLFHQANKFMLDYLFKKLKIPPEKTHFFLEDMGNTSGSTVPLVLTDAWRAGKIRPGALVCMMGFGVGLSWAATVVRWPSNTLGPVPSSSS